MIILVPLMNVTGNLRTYIRNSNTGIHDTLIEDYEIIDDSVDEEKKTVHYEASDNVTGDEEVVIVSKETGREKIHFNKYAKYIAAVVIVVLAVISGCLHLKEVIFLNMIHTKI